jgi:hypothetical protein
MSKQETMNHICSMVYKTELYTKYNRQGRYYCKSAIVSLVFIVDALGFCFSVRLIAVGI